MEIGLFILACFQSLLCEARRIVNQGFYEDVVFQIGFRHVLGYGVRRDGNECRKWLTESRKQGLDLGHQLNLVQSLNCGRRYDPSEEVGV